VNFGKSSALDELFLLVHDGLGQTCDKTHEREAKLDDPVKECRESRRDLGWIVEQGLDGLGLFDNLCLCDRRSRHDEGIIIEELVRTVGIRSGLKGVDRPDGRWRRLEGLEVELDVFR